MAPPAGFQHLPLPRRFSGDAALRGGGDPAPETVANRQHRAAHSGAILGSANTLAATWGARKVERQREALPDIGGGVPLLLKVDPALDLDDLRAKFQFEIVAEHEDGYVIVASGDINLTPLRAMLAEFVEGVRGSATIASIHRLYDGDDQSERLRRTLSEALYERWPALDDDRDYVVDVGVECLGHGEIPRVPARGKRDDDAKWAAKQAAWSQARLTAYQAWDNIKSEREAKLGEIVAFYGGELLRITEEQPAEPVRLPDSFTVRVRIRGKGLRDLVLNYPYVFEVVEPDDLEPRPPGAGGPGGPPAAVEPTPPPADAPSVCVIDSGIQEGHYLLRPGIDAAASLCLLPNRLPNDVADEVPPGGHGTRVAGAVLFGEAIPIAAPIALECWIQNARVLDEDCRMPQRLHPATALRLIIERLHLDGRRTRIFNQSINASRPCALRHMSAWAAEIDALSEENDVLVIQSAGNIPPSGPPNMLGVREHLLQGRAYPGYLAEAGCRIANPAQSLAALTVGSVAYDRVDHGGWQSVSTAREHASAFSRTGFGVWGVIKPEVVEYAGDYLRTDPPALDVSWPLNGRNSYPLLVRSTLFPPGPAFDRDAVGTSFAAPKVARVAARLQAALPNETAQLYRALIVQSARWPSWANAETGEGLTQVLRRIGYGVPEAERAATNTEFRTTLIASRDTGTGEELRIRAGECHVFQVPIPESLRGAANNFRVRIDVTLAYAAQPRRTRRNLRRYLSTWVDWKSSKLGESVASFASRALKAQYLDGPEIPGTPIPWMIDFLPQAGRIPGVKRNAGTVQKDWAVVDSGNLPEGFCIGVVGHRGWSHDPESSAKYALAVSFEVLDQEVPIYEDMRVAVEELRAEIDAEAAVEAETEVDAEE